MSKETDLKNKLATMLGAGVMAATLAAAPVTFDLANGTVTSPQAWASDSGESGGFNTLGKALGKVFGKKSKTLTV